MQQIPPIKHITHQIWSRATLVFNTNKTKFKESAENLTKNVSRSEFNISGHILALQNIKEILTIGMDTYRISLYTNST